MEGEGYTPSKQTVKEVESASLFSSMEDVIDKLKILDYENLFCKQRSSPALQKTINHCYFALPHSNPNEQFYYFTSLTAWLLNTGGRAFGYPGQFDDPNATSTNIVEALKSINFSTDFPPTKLTQGFGEMVVSVLGNLCDWALEKRNFKFLQPVQMQSKELEDQVEEEEDADETLIADETIVDDDEAEEILETIEERENNENGGALEPSVDAAEWKLEVERVAPRLQISKSVDQKDWRTHFETMKAHQKTIQSLIGDTKTQLDKMAAEITSTLEKIETREKFINSQFESLIQEYRAAKENLVEVNDKQLQMSERVTELTNEMQSLIEELDSVKQQMEQHGNQMTDTTPLLRLKSALTKLREEVSQFDVRIGVVENTLLLMKVRSKQ